MLHTEVIEQTATAINRARDLHKEIDQLIHEKDGFTQRQQSYKAIESEFKDYSSIAEALLTEVTANLASGLRPKEEQRYLEWVTSVIGKVKAMYELVESTSWEDDLYIMLSRRGILQKGPRIDDDDKKATYAIIEQVRATFYDLSKEIEKTVKAVQESSIVKENPADFPSIVPKPSEMPSANTNMSAKPVPESTQHAIKTPAPTIPAKSDHVKLLWTGTHDMLYDVFRQLKNRHSPDGKALLDVDYDLIAQFIQQSFVDFEDVKISTIRGRLTKSARPKKAVNRIDLDLADQADLDSD